MPNDHEDWKNYIKIPSDVERKDKYNQIVKNKNFNEIKPFLEKVLFDDPNPMTRIKAAKLLMDNINIIGFKFVAELAEIAQTDSMLEGYIGLIVLLKPYIEKHNLPYEEHRTKPWVFDKLRKIYLSNNQIKL